MSKIGLYFLAFCLTANLFAHPFNVSVTTIKCSTDNSKLEVTMRIFLDDMERHFEQDYNKKLNIGTSNEDQNTKQLLISYLNSSFKIHNKQSKLSYVVLGYEVENDILWLYIESPTVEYDDLKVTNTMLTDVFDNQSNMINYECESTKKSVVLDKDNNTYAF